MKKQALAINDDCYLLETILVVPDAIAVVGLWKNEMALMRRVRILVYRRFHMDSVGRMDKQHCSLVLGGVSR